MQKFLKKFKQFFQSIRILTLWNVKLKGFSCLNFWDKAWWFLSVRVFGLLSSSLLFFSQRFGHFILQPSSGVSCLSGHRNDSTWEIIFKVDCWTPCLINSQTLKMISQVESFLCPNKRGKTKEGWRIQWPKRCEKKTNKDEDNSPKTLTERFCKVSEIRN